jgi:predicted phage terminase large subunit-like protein
MLGFARAVYPNFKEGPHHRKLAKIFTDVIEGRKKRVIINIAPRMGKLLADETPVLTTQGWKTHGALAVGDFVFHPNGKPVEVLGVSAKHAADVRVEFSNGEVFYCHENHEWTLWSVEHRCYETLETGEFLRPQKGKQGRTAAEMYLLPGVNPLQFDTAGSPAKKKNWAHEKGRVGLKSVTLDPQGKVGNCITVSSPDGLYLVGETLLPTHNSEFSSYLFPAYFLGKYPDKKIIMGTHTASLSEDFGRRIRNLVDSEEYQQVFPETRVASDQKAAGKWSTSSGGQYYAAGVGGALAGRGADLFVIDDPHALPVDTEVPTSQGFKKLGELNVGDEVFGPDGQPTKVLAKSKVWKGRPLYALTTDDGEVVHCDAAHLWTYHTETSQETATSEQLAQWDKPNKPHLPRHYPAQYPHANLLVDPYVLGAWLGGVLTGLGIDLGPIGVKDIKNIPPQYMTASVAQRIALLKGLMETDGDVSEAEQSNFNTCNKDLALSVRELVHSLGTKTKIHCYLDARPNHSPVYRVTFKMADCCRMERKNKRTFTPTDKRRRSFTVAKTAAVGDVQCITVAREDGLFLVGRGYVVTHNSEQDIKVNSRLAFDTAWSWFQTGPLQRLMPGGGIIVVMCMTGDTQVLLADGTEKNLRDMKVGDAVATYEDGGIKTSKVTNFRSNGLDSIYRVRTTCGTIVRANERHPFLVDREGVRQWIKLKDLKRGMSFVVSRAAVGPHEHKQKSGDSAPLASHYANTTRKIPTQKAYQWVRTTNGKVWSALRKAVTRPLRAGACANPTTTKRCGFPADVQQLQNTGEIDASSPVTALTAQGMKHYLSLKKGFVQYVNNLREKMSGRIGAENSVSTTATTRERSEGYCATTATSPLGTEKQKPSYVAPLSTYEIVLEEIADITPDGYEEVFDVEIERTENFIANGVVSHNTRWSLLDLTGRLIDYQTKNPDSLPWEIIELPAILGEGTEDEKSLWPEQWTLEQLKSTKASLDPKFWNAQYMQQPTSDAAAVIPRTAWRVWPDEKPPKVDIIIQAWDTAFEAKTSADFSACTTWGVFRNEEEGNVPQVILLDAIKDRVQFPELKAMVLKHYRQWEPDILIVEKKASGAPLIYELRAMGIPVQDFTPSRGNDKIVRLNAVADMFSSGNVWCPDMRWAREVVEEVASFPNGEYDDYVDTVSMTLNRVRQGGMVGTDKDEKEDTQYFRRRSKGYY